jgi:hypothetical protein
MASSVSVAILGRCTDGEKWCKKHTAFRIRVRFGAYSEVVARRFSEFETLDAQLRPEMQSLPELPPKGTLKKVLSSFLDKREYRLDRLLARMVELDPRLDNPLLREFLNVKGSQLQVLQPPIGITSEAQMPENSATSSEMSRPKWLPRPDSEAIDMPALVKRPLWLDSFPEPLPRGVNTIDAIADRPAGFEALGPDTTGPTPAGPADLKLSSLLTLVGENGSAHTKHVMSTEDDGFQKHESASHCPSEDSADTTHIDDAESVDTVTTEIQSTYSGECGGSSTDSLPSPVAITAQATAQKVLGAEMVEHPNFSGNWVLKDVIGNVDQLMQLLGISWVMRKAAASSKYGVGTVKAIISQSGNRIHIEDIRPMRASSTVLHADGVQRDGVLNGKHLKVVSYWEGNVLISQRRMMGKAMPTSRRYLQEGGMVSEQVLPNGEIVKQLFVRC